MDKTYGIALPSQLKALRDFFDVAFGDIVGNLKFTLELENVVMGYILNDGMEGDKAAEKWLKANPAVWSAWLDGVTTFDGKPGLDAVKASLKL